MSHLELVALVVQEHQPAIDFFVNVLQFEPVEDVPWLTNDGRPKRWVVVRPAGVAGTYEMLTASVHSTAGTSSTPLQPFPSS
jgi:catechol 2,3-dioxygenase-like lactoylglutathione lyase family enzyme